MAHEPWALGLYVSVALIATVSVWVKSRRNRPLPHRVLSTLMIGITAAFSLFVWWIGQGEENWIANQLYLVAFGALFAVAATLSVISMMLDRGSERAENN